MTFHHLSTFLFTCLVLSLGMMTNLLPFWSACELYPDFVSTLLFLWRLQEPGSLSTVGVQSLGLVQDTLYGYPFGTSGICFILLLYGIDLLKKFLFVPSFLSIFRVYLWGYLPIHGLCLILIAYFCIGECPPSSSLVRTLLFQVCSYPFVSEIFFKIILLKKKYDLFLGSINL